MPMLPVFMILSPRFRNRHTYHVYRDLFAVHRLFTVTCFAQSAWLLSVTCYWSVLRSFWKPSAENVSGCLTWWMVLNFLNLILNPKFGCTYWLFILRPKWKLMKTLDFELSLTSAKITALVFAVSSYWQTLAHFWTYVSELWEQGRFVCILTTQVLLCPLLPIVLNTGNFKNCCTWQMSLAIKLHLHCQVQGFGA